MRVLVTVPNLHWISKHVAHRLLLLQQDRRYALSIRLPSQRPYENNLHHIVNEFVTEGFDYWLSMDADNPPQQNPLDLVELDKDIIGLPTPVWHWTGNGERPIYWNVYDWQDDKGAFTEHKTKSGLQRVDAIGTGCFLIAARVFDHPAMQAGAFQRTYYPDGTVEMGNDLAFCRRATRAGFEIYAHYDYPCDHLSELSLCGVINAHREVACG